MRNKNLTFTFILILVFFSSTPVTTADTQIYKHTDKDGKITFSNKRTKGSNHVKVTPSTPNFNSNKGRDDSHFPKVSNITQKTRDHKRKQILLHELETESKLLTNAKQMLTRTLDDSNIDETIMMHTQRDRNIQKNKIKMIQGRVLLHEKNIAALKKELASL